MRDSDVVEATWVLESTLLGLKSRFPPYRGCDLGQLIQPLYARLFVCTTEDNK